MTTSPRTTPDIHGFGRLAAALAPPSRGGSRLETRLTALTLAIRWITIVAGIVIALAKPPTPHLFLAAAGLIAVATVQTVRGLRGAALRGAKTSSAIELVFAVGAIAITGGFKSPFILTPVTGLLVAGYAWGRRATIGTAVAGAIAAAAAIVIEVADTADRAQSSQIALVFLLCGALGAFTRNLVVEMETQRAAAIDQAAQMATANDLLISLHRLAQTLPASFDLGEVVESIRQRLRALFPCTALVVLVPDDAGATWRTELTEGVRIEARFTESELPKPLRRAMRNRGPVVVTDRLVHAEDDGFAAFARSGLYAGLRARGALVGLVAIENEPPEAYGPAEQELLESLSSVLALSLDNARWFGRLHTLGAEAERGRIARELHDRVAQSLAYVTFELERLSVVPGEKGEELESLHTVVRDIMRELRETIYQLRASVTEEHQLSDVAPDYLVRFQQRTGIKTAWQAYSPRRLPYRVEQELWRIVQEALANVDRHSGASRVLVCWDVDEYGARLDVSDDGRGFEPARVSGDHYGIVGMRERADAIGARLTILSRPDHGTSVLVELEHADAPRRPIRRSA